MKKARLDIRINVPDNFKCGDCKICPLREESYTDNHYSVTTTVLCKIGYNEVTCPIITEVGTESEGKP